MENDKKSRKKLMFFGVVVVVIIFLILYILYQLSYYNIDTLKSSIDGENYNVHNLHKNKQQAADIMAELNMNVVKLFRHLKDKKETFSSNLQKRIDQLLENYNPLNVYENSSFGDGTSYTENKGEVLAVCLRQKYTDNFHDLNTLTFVVVHELAHIMNDSYGHNTEFWTYFKFILNEAVKIGIYKPIDYKAKPMRYCGMYITYNPLYDANLNINVL